MVNVNSYFKAIDKSYTSSLGLWLKKRLQKEVKG